MKEKVGIVWAALGVLILFLSFAILTKGDEISIHTLFDYFSGNLASGFAYTVLHELRLPKLIMAAMAGAGLASAGLLMQQLVNNPLADPYLISTASGASLGVNLSIAGYLPIFLPYLYQLPFYGFLFGVAATVLVITLSKQQRGIHTLLLVVGGVSLTSLLTACTSLLIYYSDSTAKLRSILFWGMGSFEKVQWVQLPILAVLLAIIIISFPFLHRHLVILILGSVKAEQLGVKLAQIQRLLLVSTALLVGIIVAYCGPIGFVGLIVPHFSRAFIGIHSKQVLLFNALAGAVFLLACEWLAQSLHAETSLPVGVVSSFIGVPFFLYLLFHRKYHFNE